MRFFDIIFSIILILIFLPIIIITFTFLYISQKNFFFLSNRIGKNGKIFKIYKFLTIKSSSVVPERETFTPCGKFLRRTSIDELPQLINVLKGEMSLVGPRPLPLEIESLLPDNVKHIRRGVLPGVTGLAQIQYTGSKRSLMQKVELDIMYIKNLSLINYLYILLQTPIILIKKFFLNKTGYSS